MNSSVRPTVEESIIDTLGTLHLIFNKLFQMYTVQDFLSRSKISMACSCISLLLLQSGSTVDVVSSRNL